MLRKVPTLLRTFAVVVIALVYAPATVLACSLAAPVWPDPRPTEAQIRAQRIAWERDYFSDLSRTARSGAAEPDRNFAGDLSRWLLPPIVPKTIVTADYCGDPPWHPSRRFSQIDAWDSEEAVAELFRLAGPVPRTFIHDLRGRLVREYLDLAATCDAEFRDRVAASLVARVPRQSLAEVWQATVENGYGESELARGPLRFRGARGGPLEFESDGSPFGWSWQSEGYRPETRHRRAMQRFFERDEDARLVVATLNAIVSEVYPLPGGNERFCPNSIQSEARIIADVRAALEEYSIRRLPPDQR